MSEPFTGEIRMFGGNFAPRGWAFCDGQLLAISQNDALFALFGTTYGGDGRTTFGLPDMRGRIPLHTGTGPGLNNRRLGSRGGSENVTLTSAQLAHHTHDLVANTSNRTTNSPSGNMIAANGAIRQFRAVIQTLEFEAGAVSSNGGSRSHSNLMPTLCVNFIVALFGVFPSRN